MTAENAPEVLDLNGVRYFKADGLAAILEGISVDLEFAQITEHTITDEHRRGGELAQAILKDLDEIRNAPLSTDGLAQVALLQ